MWKGETADWEGQRVGMWQACTSKVIALASRTREGDQRGDGGVNGSQSKFSEITWPMFQVRTDAHLFYLDQDRIVIDELLALGIELGERKQWKH
jgi:hypothetical protein